MEFLEDHLAYISRLEETLPKIADIDLARKRLTYTRWKVAENLDKLLFEFETNVKKNDAGIVWCPDKTVALEQLNKQLKQYNRISFFKHNAVKHFVQELDIKVPENHDTPDAVIIGAKFIMANTGNFYAALNSIEEFHSVINAKKIIVVAGIDTVLALQSELNMARQLYSIYETGALHYPAEIMGRPGRTRGINAEIVLFLTDLNKNALLDMPVHRPLFSLANFDLPPVCPLQRINYDSVSWHAQNTLSYILYAFMHGLKSYSRHIDGNYGLKLLDRYLPYDIDLYEQIMDARAYLHQEENKSLINKVIDSDRSSVAMNKGKFENKEKFERYAERNFFGKH